MASTRKQESNLKSPQPDGPATAHALEARLPTTVAGVDTASSKFHMYCSNGFMVEYSLPDKLSPDERRHHLYSRAKASFGMLPHNALIICEEPLALKNGKTTRLLGLAAGAIWAAHLSYSVFWAWADVAAWKKAVVGNGNASKQQIQEWVRDHEVLEFQEEDTYDAYCLCVYGQICLGLR